MDNPFKRIDKATALVAYEEAFEQHRLKPKVIKLVQKALQDYSLINSLAKNAHELKIEDSECF